MLPTMALAIPDCVSPPNENANDVVFVKNSRLIAPIPFWRTETTTITSTPTARTAASVASASMRGSSPCAAEAARS